MARSTANSLSEWGHRLLIIAQDKARFDIPGAIAIAKQIRRSSDAYREAREQIAEWDRILNPPPPVVEPSPEPSPEASSEPLSTNNPEPSSTNNPRLLRNLNPGN